MGKYWNDTVAWTGSKGLAIILARFSDQPAPASDWVAQVRKDVADKFEAWVNAASYGRATLEATVLGPYDLGKLSDFNGDLGKAMDAAVGKAQQAGSIKSNQTGSAVIFNKDGFGAYAFWSDNGPKYPGTNLRGSSINPYQVPMGDLGMEALHVMTGFGDLYETWGAPDHFDQMDCACGVHPSTFTKLKLGWLTDSDITEVPRNFGRQTERAWLQALALAPSPGTTMALRITLDVDRYYLVEYRKKTDVFEASGDGRGGIPAEGIVVYYVDENHFRPVHTRAVVPIGGHYENETRNFHLTFARSSGLDAEVFVSRANDLAKPTLDGAAAFYAYDSQVLGELGGFSNANRNSTDPRFHRRWAQAQTHDVMLAELKDKWKTEIEYRLSLDPNRGPVSGVYADFMERIMDYGVNFWGGEEIGPRSWTPNRADYVKEAKDPNTQPQWLWERIVEKTEALQHLLMESGFNAIRCIFTWESIFLAKSLVLSNPDWTSRDPYTYMKVARRSTWIGLRDELNQKWNAVFDALDRGQRPLVPQVYAEASVRMARYGIDFGSTSANSLNYGVHYRWAKSASISDVKAQTTRRVGILFAELAG